MRLALHSVSYAGVWPGQVRLPLEAVLDKAAQFGADGVQNHHDVAAHHESLLDLLREVDHPNCRACFDAWSPALQGVDLAAAAQQLVPYTAHTTIADYVRRPRFSYQPNLVNYVPEPDVVR